MADARCSVNARVVKHLHGCYTSLFIYLFLTCARSRSFFLRRAEKAGGHHEGAGEAREGHHRAGGRLQKSAFCASAAENALRQDPSLLFGEPRQRQAVQGTTRCEGGDASRGGASALCVEIQMFV